MRRRDITHAGARSENNAICESTSTKPVTSYFDRIVNAAIAAGAIAVAVVLIRREIVADRSQGPSSTILESTSLSDSSWNALRELSILGSGRSSSFTVLEFVDVECPFCARYHATLEALRDSLGEEVALGFIHFPLSQHRFARTGARAIECARPEQRGEAMLASLLMSQDSIGLIPWPMFAHRAGVRDTAEFQVCLLSTSADERIDAGVRAGKSVGVSGTPAIVVDGRLFSNPPSLSQLIAMARSRSPQSAGRPE